MDGKSGIQSGYCRQLYFYTYITSEKAGDKVITAPKMSEPPKKHTADSTESTEPTAQNTAGDSVLFQTDSDSKVPWYALLGLTALCGIGIPLVWKKYRTK